MTSLVLGDCLEKLKDIPDCSVHCVISDIPYGIDFSEWDVLHKNNNSALLGKSPAQENSSLFKSRGKPKNGWSKQDLERPLEFQKWCEGWLKEIHRILKPAGALLCMTGRQNLHRYVVACEDAGFINKDVLAWDKKAAPFRAQSIEKVLSKRGISVDNDNIRLGNLAPTWEPISWCFKPYPIGDTITDCYLKYGTGVFSSEFITSNLISISSRVKDKQHETQKPVELMEILVKTFTKEDHTILDPFMGSGTTGVACTNLNRNFIGIEMDENYFSIAQDRINKAVKGE